MRWLDVSDPRVIALGRDHLLVLVHLVHHAAEGPQNVRGHDVGACDVVTTQEELAQGLQLGRHVIRAALDHFEAVGLVAIEQLTGRGRMRISVQRPDPVHIVGRQIPGANTGTIPLALPPRPAKARQIKAPNLPTPDFSPDFSSEKPSGVADMNPPGNLAAPEVSPDRSDISEISSLSPLGDLDPPEIHMSECSPRKPRKSRPVRPKPEIPERAYRGADYLRDQILGRQPTNALAHKPWPTSKCAACGATFSGVATLKLPKHRMRGQECAGAAVAVSDVASPHRERWAKQLAEMVSRDHRNWDDVAVVIRWVFHEQRGEYRFIVDCPEALRKKWDAIDRVRRPPTLDGAPVAPVAIVDRQPALPSAEDPKIVAAFFRKMGEP